MPELIIADTSCFIALSRIDALHLLKEVYATVSTTSVIAEEFGQGLPTWITVIPTTNSMALRMLEFNVDRGEASAIALAIEHPGCTIILDDRKARVLAEALDLRVTGTMGVIVKAKLQGFTPSIKPWLAKLRGAGFRSSEAIEQALMNEAGEH